MESSPEPEAFVLLTLPSVSLSIRNATPTTQPLELLCLTVPAPTDPPIPTDGPFADDPPLPTFPSTSSNTSNNSVNPFRPPLPGRTASQPLPDKDVWLVLRLGPFESALSPQHRITHDRATGTFAFSEAEPPFTIQLPPAATLDDAEDAETLEVLLRDYGVLLAPSTGSTPPPPEYSLAGPSGMPQDTTTLRTGRGQLLLIDQSDRRVLGTIGGSSLELDESAGLHQRGHEKDPVVVDLPAWGDHATVRPAQPGDETDVLLRGAHLLSSAIGSATNALAGGLASASQLYISRVPPDPSGPTTLSPAAREGIRRVHAVSGAAVHVTARTTGAIHGLLDKAITHVGGAASSALRKPLPPGQEPPPPHPARVTAGRVLNRVLMSTDVLLTTLESSASTLVASTTDSVARSLEHRYGPDVGDASRLVGDAVRNVGVVYVDARGVGRRALLSRAGKKAVAATIKGQKVVLAESAA